MGTSVWQAVKLILVDWTVTPKMLALNKRRPIIYQLVTTPIVTLVFGFIAAVAIIGLSYLGLWSTR